MHAQNTPQTALRTVVRAGVLSLAVAAACGGFGSSVWAQTTSAAPAAPEAAGTPPANTDREAVKGDRRNQKIENIRTEDAGSRVDELRVGGQTQSITVQSKMGDVPAYEVQPNDGPRARTSTRDEGGNTGSRVWNVLKF